MRIPFVLACALMSASNAAADDLKGAFDVSGEIGVVSDYRWRGVSLTDNDPALQAGLYAAHESGLYAGVWAAAPTRNSGDLEVDLSIGGAFSLMGGDVDLSVVQYIYPDLDDTDYANFVALYERPVGDWTARDAAITQFLTDQGAAGVPLYLWYAPGASAPQQLPQVLTPALLEAQAKGSPGTS